MTAMATDGAMAVGKHPREIIEPEGLETK